MKLQKLQSLFLLFWLFLPLVGRAELVDACVAAKNTAIYPQFTQFPPVLKEQIAKYKNDWQLLCNKKSDVTLSKLLQNAQSIATDLLEIFNKLDINSKKTINYLEKINSFIPNIYGDCCEGELMWN